MRVWLCGFCAMAACSFSARLEGATDGNVADTRTVDGPQVTWLRPWQHRRAFRLLASQIEAPGDGALTGFPVFVAVDPALGANLVFTLGDGVVPLATEVESPGIAWVKVPSLSATTDTRLYLYYDHPSAPASTADQVWTDSFVGVWHLQQSPTAGTGEMLDSTAANRDGDAENSMTPADSISGKIGRGIHLDGVDDFIDYKQADFGNAFTISMWVNATSAASVRTLIANSPSGDGVDGFRLFINTVNTTDRRFVFETGNPSANADHAQTAANAVAFGQWMHVAVVVDRAAGSANLFVDGVRNTERTNTLTNFKVNSDFELGRMENDFFKLSGILDEVEVASTQRSAEWILTAFRNQSSPAAFQSPFEIEESAPP